MISTTSTLEEIAYAVCTLFHNCGKTVVLTGGSAATIYAPAHYQSRDLDFVMQFSSGGLAVVQKLQELGFESGPSSIYKHPNSAFTIDFIAGDLAVGEKYISSWKTLHKGDQILHILSPEDCICDRLASYIYWNDFSALSAAAGVYNTTHANLDDVRTWLEKENAEVDQTISRLVALAK